MNSFLACNAVHACFQLILPLFDVSSLAFFNHLWCHMTCTEIIFIDVDEQKSLDP